MRALGVNVKGYLLGNKNDVNQDRQVITDKEAHRLAEKLNLKYYKVFVQSITFSSSFRPLRGNTRVSKKPFLKFALIVSLNGAKTQTPCQF